MSSFEAPYEIKTTNFSSAFTSYSKIADMSGCLGSVCLNNTFDFRLSFDFRNHKDY